MKMISVPENYNSRIHLTRWAVTALAEKHRKQDHRLGLPGPRRPQPAGDANVRHTVAEEFDMVAHHPRHPWDHTGPSKGHSRSWAIAAMLLLVLSALLPPRTLAVTPSDTPASAEAVLRAAFEATRIGDAYAYAHLVHPIALEDFFMTFSGCTVWGPNYRISQAIFGDSLPDDRAVYFAKVLEHAQWFGGCSPSQPKPEVTLKVLDTILEGDTTLVVFRATPTAAKKASFVAVCTTVRTRTGYALIPSVTAQDLLMQLGVGPKEQ